MLTVVFFMLVATSITTYNNVQCQTNNMAGFMNVQVQGFNLFYRDMGNGQTAFRVQVPHPTSQILSQTNSWISVGFNNRRMMDNTTAVVCKSTSNGRSVEHYYLNGKVPELLNAAQPSAGLSNGNIVFDSTHTTCSFQRENSRFNQNRNYYDLESGSPFIIVAWGTNQFTGATSDRPMYHGPNQRGSSNTRINIANRFSNGGSGNGMGFETGNNQMNYNSASTSSHTSGLVLVGLIAGFFSFF